MTLMSVHNSEGCYGRCDAKCYNATSSKCTCLCGGMNHGVGKSIAMSQTAEYADQLLEKFGKKELRIHNWQACFPFM